MPVWWTDWKIVTPTHTCLDFFWSCLCRRDFWPDDFVFDIMWSSICHKGGGLLSGGVHLLSLLSSVSLLIIDSHNHINLFGIPKGGWGGALYCPDVFLTNTIEGYIQHKHDLGLKWSSCILIYFFEKLNSKYVLAELLWFNSYS